MNEYANPNGYFHRVQAETPTRFWINNPTLDQARKALDAGAQGCTTNPSYVSKLFSSQDDMRVVRRFVDLLVRYEKDDSLVATKVQAMMVARIADAFLPLYRSSGGKAGYVTIQGDPFRETDAKAIIDEGMENRALSENIMVKIPVTEPGIEAISYFVSRDVPTMATEVMGISQAISICEAYKKASASSGKSPLFYVTHITGILDDFFKAYVASKGISVSPQALKWAGLAVAKREYALLKARRYPGTMMGGGARKLEDFTELVGGDLSVTINWEGTADTLIEADGPVVPRVDEPVDPAIIAELQAAMPDFVRAYEPEGMKPMEYYDYGGVELFRNAFMKGWNQLLALVAERRRSL
ncbi:MAG TPA: transaldolase family protein [Rectinemataceae bacterium]